MTIRNYASQEENQLSTEITGLNERLAQFSQPETSDARCVSSYLKQLVKSKRDKLAALRYRRNLSS